MENKVLDWHSYFMALSKVSALRSKDPNTKVGACIVDDNKRVVSLGYNGMPRGDDKNFSWKRDNEKAADNKYAYVIHAEINAILNANKQIDSKCVLYVSLFPCSNCAKIIAQVGINQLYYEEDKYNGTEDDIISKKILDSLEVKYKKIPKVSFSI
ncbi:deoxycytidylate deaminase [[Mycoplasma] mobile]|uniref:Deoxycytidylate deaminase competance related protein n=1 Tax=Mycoplasma mobile (strain ATCC 43663 / 163K / NCTC 11711) TaxID=267748 RepID=Q6KHB4_MYCM1|nr:dCMP deaminase family protein [[Mycoplasma] mobile]AAT28016.1 deoxycytidylate deaminase competance related protein [Mycoplasma mobile 163K]